MIVCCCMVCAFALFLLGACFFSCVVCVFVCVYVSFVMCCEL